MTEPDPTEEPTPVPGAIAVPLNLEPVPTNWDIRTQAVGEGLQAVIVQVSTPVGLSVFWFDDVSARRFGQQMLDAAKRASISIAAPTGLIIPNGAKHG